MALILGFATLVYLKVIFEVITRTGMSLSAAIITAIGCAAASVAFDLWAGLSASKWSSDAWLENAYHEKKLPITAIGLPFLAFVSVSVAFGYVVIIGFSSKLARNMAYEVENGDFSTLFALAVPAVAHGALIYFTLRKAMWLDHLSRRPTFRSHD